MSVVPYERQLELPTVRSPFLRGTTGPGFIGEPKSKASEEDDEFDEPKRAPKVDRQRRANPTPPQPHVPLPVVSNVYSQRPGLSRPGPPAPTITTTPYRAPSSVPQFPSTQTTRNIASIMGGQQVMDQLALREPLPQDTGEQAIFTSAIPLLMRP